MKLANYPHSAGNNGAFYEPELFPALQINKFLPTHIAVFSSGRCVLTGLTDLTSALPNLLTNLIAFLSSYHLFGADAPDEH